MVVGIVLIPLLFVVMGSAIGTLRQAVSEVATATNIAVVDLDDTQLTQSMLMALNESFNGRVKVVDEGSVEALLEDYGLVLALPRGFSNSIKTSRVAVIDAYVSLNSLSMASTTKLELADRASKIMTDVVRASLASMSGLNSSILEVSVAPRVKVFIGGLGLSGEEMNALLNAIFSSVFIVVLISILVLQFGAFNMAQEKEDKTFEVLLSQPVPRVQVGLAKVIGVVVVSIMEGVVFIFSWTHYMGAVAATGASFNIFEVILEKSGLVGVVLFFADILIVMLVMAVVGLILGGLARDTRSAGMMVVPLWFLVMMILMATQFVEIPFNSLTLIGLSAAIIPSPWSACTALVLGDLSAVLASIAVNVVELLVLLYLLKRMLEGEVMIVGFTRLGAKFARAPR